MPRRWVGRLGTMLLVLAALPATAPGQVPGQEPGQTRRCNQVLRSDARQIVNALGQEIVYFRDPVRVVCTGGLVLEADSAMINRAEGAIQLVGDVVYRDSTRQLQADWANYLGGPDELYARGNVVLEDPSAGSRITGDELEFRRQTAQRPQSLTIVRGQRPYAILPPSVRDDPGPSADTAAPVEVWANRFRIEGEALFLAQGDAEFRRGTLRGAADTARFDQLGERLLLVGRGRVEEDRYRLQGDSIVAFLPGDTLREVRARGAARLFSDQLRVGSDRIRIGLVEGQLDRLEAWNPEGLAAHRPPPASTAADTATGGGGAVTADTAGTEAPADALRDVAAAPDTADSPERPARPDSAAPGPVVGRAVAVAEGFELWADSIDARADAGRIREVRAVSRAYGEREADSLAAPGAGDTPPTPPTPSAPPTPVPAGGVEGPRGSMIGSDWIQGDTIIGYFAVDTAGAEAGVEGAADADPTAAAGVDLAPGEAPGEEADSAGVVLDRIVVIGGSGPALSLYRMAPEEGRRERSINFMRAARITLHMVRGELARVEADGPIAGIYLDPVQPGAEGEGEGGAPSDTEPGGGTAGGA